MAVTLETTMEALLHCFCTELGKIGWEGSCCLETGPVVLDECCSDVVTGEHGGKAWVRLIDVYPSAQFPVASQAASLTADQTQLAARFEVGAITCVCLELCDCETRSENARRTLAIAEAALASLVCCTAPVSGCLTDARFAGLSQVGTADSGCAGYSMVVAVPYEVCCSTED